MWDWVHARNKRLEREAQEKMMEWQKVMEEEAKIQKRNQ